MSKRSKAERHCFKCEIEVTNVGLINLYKGTALIPNTIEFVERKKKEKEELASAITKKRKEIGNLSQIIG